MGKVKTTWVCGECGHSQAKWTGSCSICNHWNTFVEEVDDSDEYRYESAPEQVAKPVLINEVRDVRVNRIQSGIKEFDRLVGGGIVVGSLFLVGGDPGIGKSTFMIQLSQALSSQGLTILYICGEESVEQTSMRAERLGVKGERVYLLSETNFGRISKQVDYLKPDILIVDSILHILCLPFLKSFPTGIIVKPPRVSAINNNGNGSKNVA